MTKAERIARKLGHTKQERLQIKHGTPLIRDLKEGVPALRVTSEGIVEYIKSKGALFKTVLKRA